MIHYILTNTNTKHLVSVYFEAYMLIDAQLNKNINDNVLLSSMPKLNGKSVHTFSF